MRVVGMAIAAGHPQNGLSELRRLATATSEHPIGHRRSGVQAPGAPGLDEAPSPSAQGSAVEVLDALYGGLLTETPWDGFLRLIADWLDATYASLVLTAPGENTPAEVLTPGIEADKVDDYAETLFATDPFVGLPEGQVIAFSEFIAHRTLDEDWRRFFDDTGNTQILGVDIRSSTGLEARFRITRNRSRSDFHRLARNALQSLVPHLRHAVALYERLNSHAVEHGVYRVAMEQMAVATLILDHKGRILRSNAVADRMVATADGLRVRSERLMLAAPNAQAALQRLLLSPPAEAEVVRIRIPRTSGARDLTAAVRGAGGLVHLGSGQAALALFVVDPAQPPRASPEALQDIFQLTRAEAALTAVLADGVSLIDASRQLGITHNTSRSHLRAIFAKTGARRQSQLVRLVRTSLAGLSAPDAPF